MKAAGIFLLEALLIFAALFGAHLLEPHISFIPSFVISLPEVDYTGEDFRTVLWHFGCVYLVLLAATAAYLGPWRPSDVRRTVQELFAIALGFAIASMSLFLTTEIAFDPNLIVGIAILASLLVISAHLISAASTHGAPGSRVLLLIREILRVAFRSAGIAIILAALTPGILAFFFVGDRDFANTVTRIRIWFSDSEQAAYQLVDLFPGERFAQPMLVRPRPGDPGVLYILGRAGTLERIDYPSGEGRSLVLDIRDKVGEVESENGFLGFDFHPEFARAGSGNEGVIYAYYTSVKNGEQVNHVSKFTLREDAGAKVQTEAPLMVLPREPSGFHNGGSVAFGPDGLLYLALGEGVHPKTHKGINETFRGAILRIDVDCRHSDRSQPITRRPAVGQVQDYCIPRDNPFVGNPAILDEYWALGLRNPYRMNFDADGRLWVGDVGSTKWEEVNIVEAGHHYQYPFIEGYEAAGPSRPDTVIGTETPPVHTYVHTAYDRAVIGGIVYQGKRHQALRGQYLFADNYSSKVFSMPASGRRVDSADHIATADQFAQRGTSSLTELADGEVVLTTLGRSSTPTGRVLKLSSGDAQAPAPAAEAEPASTTAAEVHSIYIANCARCHGNEGRGDGPDAGMLPVPVPDFHDDDVRARENSWYHRVIGEGGYAAGLSPAMPPWAHILNEAEIDGLVKLIREFQENPHDGN
ncbi:PQQ-dependent sugar dehydrogenase [Parahaliea mediterranea]|uniref:PQQ-dependent sugar dehydrogenase n=1 Tax=Parahaliea mediterranea TaxID=651086 RepID=A0A939DGH8_9GAMM|nr:PQQ-dependent sugar dehydrogenase [Parahaliea mediterranea]MBN7797441.1 PQQ-dependent sugar dehydrogenase [Parahaliea mediterranea]